MSLSENAKEAIYLRCFLSELGYGEKTGILLYCDNQGAINLAENPVFHNRTKHIDIRHHFVRDASKEGQIKLEYVPIGEMVADIFTKGLAGPRHKEFSSRMGLNKLI